jgi:ribosomal protein L37AE/L43A
MGIIDRIRRVYEVEGGESSVYVCLACDTAFDVQHHACPACDSFDLRRSEWVAD